MSKIRSKKEPNKVIFLMVLRVWAQRRTNGVPRTPPGTRKGHILSKKVVKWLPNSCFLCFTAYCFVSLLSCLSVLPCWSYLVCLVCPCLLLSVLSGLFDLVCLVCHCLFRMSCPVCLTLFVFSVLVSFVCLVLPVLSCLSFCCLDSFVCLVLSCLILSVFVHLGLSVSFVCLVGPRLFCVCLALPVTSKLKHNTVQI